MKVLNNVLLTASRVEISATGKTPTNNILAYPGGLMHAPGWGHLVIDLSRLGLGLSPITMRLSKDSLVIAKPKSVTGNCWLLA